MALRYTKYKVNEDKLTEENPVFMYLVGLIATDGHINKKHDYVAIRFSGEECISVFTALRELLEIEAPVFEYTKANNYKTYELRITSTHLIEKLEELGITRRGKEYLTVPKSFHNDSCKLMYMRGILDGDGNVHVVKSKYTGNWIGGQFRIVKESKAFIQGIIDVINERLGTSEKLSTAKVRGVSYPKLEASTEASKAFYTWIYEGFPDLKFASKHEKAKLICSWL